MERAKQYCPDIIPPFQLIASENLQLLDVNTSKLREFDLFFRGLCPSVHEGLVCENTFTEDELNIVNALVHAFPPAIAEGRSTNFEIALPYSDDPPIMLNLPMHGVDTQQTTRSGHLATQSYAEVSDQDPIPDLCMFMNCLYLLIFGWQVCDNPDPSICVKFQTFVLIALRDNPDISKISPATPDNATLNAAVVNLLQWTGDPSMRASNVYTLDDRISACWIRDLDSSVCSRASIWAIDKIFVKLLGYMMKLGEDHQIHGYCYNHAGCSIFQEIVHSDPVQNYSEVCLIGDIQKYFKIDDEKHSDLKTYLTSLYQPNPGSRDVPATLEEQIKQFLYVPGPGQGTPYPPQPVLMATGVDGGATIRDAIETMGPDTLGSELWTLHLTSMFPFVPE